MSIKRNNKRAALAQSKSEKFKKQAARYNMKVNEFSQLSDEQLNETLKGFQNREIKGSAIDKQAFLDVYQKRFLINEINKAKKNERTKNIEGE
jgi:hypothetical protein